MYMYMYMSCPVVLAGPKSYSCTIRSFAVVLRARGVSYKLGHCIAMFLVADHRVFHPIAQSSTHVFRSVFGFRNSSHLTAPLARHIYSVQFASRALRARWRIYVASTACSSAVRLIV